MSIRGRIGSIRIRRSTTNVSPACSVSMGLRPVSTDWPPQRKEEVFVMRDSVRLTTCVLVSLVVASLAAQEPGIREVTASGRSLIPLSTKIRYTTMILLPEGEEILDVVCGDKDFWVISASQNIAHVKPAKEGAATNLNLVTASGTVYSFLLQESKNAPDLKLYVTADPN